jgi:primosomal protein N' (replication factor Y)
MAIAKVEPLTTARALRGPFDYLLPERLGDVGVGSVLLVPFGRRRVLGVVVDVAEASELAPERLAEPLEALEAGVPPELVRLGLWTAREYCSTPARGLGLVLPPDTLRRLRSDRLIRRREPKQRRRPEVLAIGEPARPVKLNSEQRAAVGAIVAAIEGEGPRELLLHGVTGSGKTEVYLAAAEEALARGRGAIVLVPEIALTPQTVTRLRTRLGDGVALLHSGMGAGERYDEWRRLRSGDARVCAGPRSAVFAPVADLGLVVIDEEHDSSYKQEGDPRYDAREVARRRAADAGAALVCGSATPRPESWLELERLELRARVDQNPMPEVNVLDMRERDGRAGPLHARTREALVELRETGGKAIVLLNRRGWAPFYSCRSCGHAFECPRCDVSLVLHRRADDLRCHHCAHAEAVPEKCPRCESVTLARHGSGTERIESVIADLVAPLPVLRLDSDSASRAGAHGDILRRFQEADAGVLVGTQMVGKGHDFADVSLSVILDADATLRFPDFRAEERAYALVAQLAGRSGRGPGGGRVLVQTLAPDAGAIRHAARHDTAGFLAAELERRRELRYPPFSHLVRVELAAPEAERVSAAATDLAEAIAVGLPAGAELLGPAPRFRVRGRHRRQLLVKSGERDPAVAAVREAVEGAVSARALRGIALAVDVSPQ